jgi:asparagine synthase (glutamine-hydrolysing)
MSGIVGIFHRDGRALEASQLRSMTDFLAYRGPDGQDLWVGSQVGFGHTLLNTSQELGGQKQPIHMESLWITADVRLDSKTDLLNKLQAIGRRIEGYACDAELILHAYAAWGTRCVEHLRGDFSFVVWDSVAKTLFCARDHFGIKPFYYAELGEVFTFSNTLNCLRQHTGVSNQLNEQAIGDFLLFGWNYNESSTSFRDIQRLPPAHWLLVSRECIDAKRYWNPPTQDRIRYRRSADYVDNFMELFQAAVVDRLPADRAGILLSGGLDSGAVAAVANAFSKSRGGSPSLRSYTAGYDWLIPDNDNLFARQSSEYLDIPNEYLPLDNVEFFEKWEGARYRHPEPVASLFFAAKFELYRRLATHCRVALSGEGSDNLMYFQMWPYLKDLSRRGEWSRLIFETAWFLWIRPFPWLGVARRVQRIFGKVRADTEIPRWIAPEFAKRARLKERWTEYNKLIFPFERHSVRPKAHASMVTPRWAGLFESEDPGVTQYPVEVRYPFLDLRIVRYLMAIPVFPWAFKKKLLRDSMYKKLPERVRLRPKTPVSRDPIKAKLRKMGACINEGPLSPQAAEFVNANSNNRMDADQIRAYYLREWLKAIN